MCVLWIRTWIGKKKQRKQEGTKVEPKRYWNRVWSTTVLRVRTPGSMGTWSYELIQQMKRYRMLVSPQTKAAVILASEGSTEGRAIVAPSRTTNVMTTDTKWRLHWA